MKPYITSLNVNCGPCSFINLTEIKGSKKIEEDLAKIGKLKPFKISDWTSYLIWADKYHKEVKVFVTKVDLDQKMFKLIQCYEKIGDDEMKKLKTLAVKRYNGLKKKYNDRFTIIKNPLDKLNELLDDRHRVAITVSDYYLKRPRDPAPHAIVAVKRIGVRYYFYDSAKSNGKTILTKNELKRAFEINKQQGFYPGLVAYKIR